MFNVVHLHEIGEDPDVLIDNTKYPIGTKKRNDDAVAISLRKFETKNTRIPDDELHALPYDKEGSVIRQHRETLEEKVLKHSLWSLAPEKNSQGTPVIATNGAITVKDIIAAKDKMDRLNLPLQGRKLVLCSSHVNQLLESEADSKYFNPLYHRIADGKIANMYGFEVYENQNTVSYDASKKKKAFEATSANTDADASAFFFAPNAIKATGTAKMYQRKYSNDPENRESVIGFRLYHNCLAVQKVGFGAIVTG